jgi:UDP-3-O-[3-hydroxymyristoyl] N-acetylglucosamine deacetylase
MMAADLHDDGSHTIVADLFDQAAGSAAPRQHTLKSSIGCTGIGLHSGAKVSMTLHPAAPDSGIRFRRTDLGGAKGTAGATLPALWSQVGDTRMNTTLAGDNGVVVGTVEHLMSALAGCGVDNCLIEINGPEVPVMDGSAAQFVFLVECAGLAAQAAPRRAIQILKPVVVHDGDRMARLDPADEFSVHFEIDFNSGAIARQERRTVIGGRVFKSDIARARTFGFEQDVAALRAAGLARGGSLDNAVVIDSTGNHVLNDDGLRYPDEFVRHKILDAIGDLYLAGGPILGRFHGVRSGHALTNRLLRTLFADRDAWRAVPMPAGGTAPAARVALG